MFKKTFGKFLDNHKKQTLRELKLIKDVLKTSGLEVKTFFDDRVPYIFCKSDQESATFEGIRIYKFGDIIAFRMQDSPEGVPFGSSYSMPIESMFANYMEENSDKIKAGKKLISAIISEVKDFFKKSSHAELDLIPQKKIEIKNLKKDLKDQEINVRNL